MYVFKHMNTQWDRDVGRADVRTDLPSTSSRGCCSSLRLTAQRFKARCCTQLPAQDFLIRVGDLASALPRNKSPSLSGAFPAALLSGISLSAHWLSSPDIFIQERKKMETVCGRMSIITTHKSIRGWKWVKTVHHKFSLWSVTCFPHHQN